MPMRPEDLMQLMAQTGQNPMAAALGRYAGAPMPQGMPQPGGTPRPAPLPPSPAPSMGVGMPQHAYPETRDQTDGAPTDEDMLSQVSDGMGGGDMEAAKQALVEMYQSGDPSDPRTLEQWRQAKQDFIDQYGEENLPDLPNDPEEQGETTPDDETAEDGQQYAYEDSPRKQQSMGEYDRLKQLGKRRNIG